MGALQHKPKPQPCARTGHVSPGLPIRGTPTENPLLTRGFSFWFRFDGVRADMSGR